MLMHLVIHLSNVMSEAVSFVLGTQSTLHILDYPDEGGPLSMAHAFQRIYTLHVWFCRGLLCMAEVLFSRMQSSLKAYA